MEAYNAEHPEAPKAAYEITVKQFSDFSGEQLDPTRRADHHQLIDKIKTELPERNVKTYDLQLDPSLQRTQDSVTEAYLQQFADDFYDTIFGSMQQEIESFEEIDAQLRELNEQAAFLAERARIFVGRQPFLQKIADYLENDSEAPLIITADSGSGKSALMAKVIQQALANQPEATTLLYRFVGTSERSSTPMHLYQSLYQQLMEDEELLDLRESYLEEKRWGADQLVGDLKELQKLLAYLIENYPDEQQLILFVDALDQFMLQDPLQWLPTTLPSHTKIILSTLPETYQGVPYLPKLKQRYRNHPENLLFLEPFNATEASAMIEEYLQAQQRKVTASQKQKLLDAFLQSGSPLYLKILLEEATEWASYDDVADEDYPKELEELIARLFQRLHTHSHHSLPLVNFAFAYLACSKDGMAEAELFDILSQEEQLMEDVSNEFYPKPTHLPTAVWARLYSQMSHYFTTKELDGMAQISFFHRKFNEGAYRLNLNLVKEGMKYRPDPTRESSKEAKHERMAEFYEQVYHQTIPVETSEGAALTELPYQRMMSGQKQQALELLTNFEFLMKKLRLNRTQEVLGDYALAKTMGIHQGAGTSEESKERHHIFDAFLTSNQRILERGDREWDSSKIFFQLSIEHADQSPLTQSAEQYERAGKVDFDYVRDVNRDEEFYISLPCDVLEGHSYDVKVPLSCKMAEFSLGQLMGPFEYGVR